jgi:hypothetical protein
LLLTLKKIYQTKPFTLLDVIAINERIPVDTHRTAKNALELIDMIVKLDEKITLSKQSYEALKNIVQLIIDEFVKGKIAICSDLFKIKWLEVYVEIMRSLNISVRIFKDLIAVETKDLIVKSIKKIIKVSNLVTK